MAVSIIVIFTESPAGDEGRYGLGVSVEFAMVVIVPGASQLNKSVVNAT
jgi:hypothetical protein